MLNQRMLKEAAYMVTTRSADETLKSYTKFVKHPEQSRKETRK